MIGRAQERFYYRALQFEAEACVRLTSDRGLLKVRVTAYISFPTAAHAAVCGFRPRFDFYFAEARLSNVDQARRQKP
jgi:hypothetical protein